MANPYIGEIRMFAGNFAPVGWALCQGQLMAITSNTALFSILGITYGGNGTTTFALPDFRGRVPLSSGQGLGLSNYFLGEQAGNENIALTSSQMPSHTHLVAALGSGGTQASPINGFPAIESTGTSMNYSTSYSATFMNPQMLSTAGGSQPHYNIQPILCVNFIIALTGIFPTQA